ncbi:hypothetical protein DICPUDRAFT_79538 [Dictyostelium purpureum]|uniref:SDE2-like domain-containing protein n=1 Tax=Dictyostelium purpureum TaxID=5786 RepID=F0ZMW1_DICPU|nr:uncharacterized protein DICPUDRAFT_79538 [Dictyostelium purpureum]EGC34720.1 hypothetical protein DICPUDRAFT_79538 [Dictyostelium purpureum]|eukprot:XP_003288761.1 hypothetical protein DICPUDRAFT_79538 [Dictyostelium purpureum]
MEVLIKLPYINNNNSKILNIKLNREEVLCEEYLKLKIFEKTFIPVAYQYLKLISSSEFKVYDLLLRVNGGKGGFGSLLKSTGTRVGQKKTTNFDACRDLSGRRLRHVNNEKKLKEWMEDEESRKLALAELKKNLDNANEILGIGKSKEEFNDTQFQKDHEDLQKKVSNSVEQGLKELKKQKELEKELSNTTTTTKTTTTTTTAAVFNNNSKKPTISKINNNKKPISVFIPDFSDEEDEEEEEENNENNKENEQKEINKKKSTPIKVSKTK